MCAVRVKLVCVGSEGEACMCAVMVKLFLCVCVCAMRVKLVCMCSEGEACVYVQ